jgi:hypothetical protein
MRKTFMPTVASLVFGGLLISIHPVAVRGQTAGQATGSAQPGEQGSYRAPYYGEVPYGRPGWQGYGRWGYGVGPQGPMGYPQGSYFPGYGQQPYGGPAGPGGWHTPYRSGAYPRPTPGTQPSRAQPVPPRIESGAVPASPRGIVQGPAAPAPIVPSRPREPLPPFGEPATPPPSIQPPAEQPAHGTAAPRTRERAAQTPAEAAPAAKTDSLRTKRQEPRQTPAEETDRGILETVKGWYDRARAAVSSLFDLGH